MFPAQNITITDNDTVLSVLQRVCSEKKLQLDCSVVTLAYIHGIGGLSEFDGGQTSGWVYRVNGEVPSAASNQYKLKPGDRVEWIYSLDAGKSEGYKK